MENVKCKLGYLSRPDGSVLLYEGETTVVAGIYGPIEARSNKILIDKASVEVHYRPKSGHPGIKNRLYESIIKNICEISFCLSLYPRTSVLVVLQELHNSGQLISCAINAACLAALDSGIDMKCMFGAVTCFLHNDGALSLTPPPIDGNSIKGTFVFVFDSARTNIVASHTEGSFSLDQYEQAVFLCKNKSSDVFDFFQKSIAINE